MERLGNLPCHPASEDESWGGQASLEPLHRRRTGWKRGTWRSRPPRGWKPHRGVWAWLQSSLLLSGQLCRGGSNLPIGNGHCPLLTPSLQPHKQYFVTSGKTETCLQRPVSIFCLLSTWTCSGAGRRRGWSWEALEFPILGLPDPQQPPLFVLLALGEDLGLSRPPHSAGDKLLSREGCFASFLSF